MSHHYYLVLMMACCLPWLFFAFGLVFCLSLGYAGIFDPACFAHTYNKACTWIFISVVTHFCNISRKRKYINPTTTSKKQAKRHRGAKFCLWSLQDYTAHTSDVTEVSRYYIKFIVAGCITHSSRCSQYLLRTSGRICAQLEEFSWVLCTSANFRVSPSKPCVWTKSIRNIIQCLPQGINALHNMVQ